MLFLQGLRPLTFVLQFLVEGAVGCLGALVLQHLVVQGKVGVCLPQAVLLSHAGSQVCPSSLKLSFETQILTAAVPVSASHQRQVASGGDHLSSGVPEPASHAEQLLTEATCLPSSC